MILRAVPAVDWETLHLRGDNVLIHLMADDPRLHLLVIPCEVLEDAFRSSNVDTLADARAHKNEINTAVARAWQPDRMQEMFEVTGTGRRNVQLWLTRKDFSKKAT